MRNNLQIMLDTKRFNDAIKDTESALAKRPPAVLEAAITISGPAFHAHTLAQIAQHHQGVAQLIHAFGEVERLMAEVTALTMLDEESVRAKIYKWIGREPLQIHIDDLAGLVANCDSYLREAAVFVGAIAYVRDYYARFGRFPKKREIRPLKGVG